MSIALLSLIVCFVILMLIGFPIAFNLILSSIVYLLVGDYPLTLVSQRMFQGMNGFALLAVPFFILTGQLMVKGSILRDLTDFVNAFVGHVRGALALVTVGTCLFMGAIVGLAVAATASLGSFLIPMMKEEGYKPAFASGVMASASLLGPIMPPSVLMILYCISVGRTSIAGIFLGSIIPAFLIAIAQMVVIYFIAKKDRLPNHEKVGWPQKWKQFRKALPALFLPVIILGGIFGGVFTVTEASAAAAAYAFVLVVFVTKEVKLSDFPGIFMETAVTSGLVILLAGSATVTAWAIANEQVIQTISGPLAGIPLWAFLGMLNVLLLINGMFMDDYASVIVLGPILAPIAWALGVDPIQIGIIICVNLVIGLATPPFGITLFVTSPMSGVSVEDTFKRGWPMLVASIVVLLFVTYYPPLTLWLPRMFGY
ncbi:MAG TPA: TRAP transporter large permease [Deltaproteobacteria bacterium]|nr:TRAP transporter large permease [Deltaproteobacteria bacterium]HPJ93535.1 TRAP transporter large permease [Deltaproteobacteria bacterium]HPR51130.1 TRAP transporter large permease [Deltaproteobacteria bacterium]